MGMARSSTSSQLGGQRQSRRASRWRECRRVSCRRAGPKAKFPKAAATGPPSRTSLAGCSLWTAYHECAAISNQCPQIASADSHSLDEPIRLRPKNLACLLICHILCQRLILRNNPPRSGCRPPETGPRDQNRKRRPDVVHWARPSGSCCALGLLVVWPGDSFKRRESTLHLAARAKREARGRALDPTCAIRPFP